MVLYKLGSKGKEVEQIQVELKALGYYRGPIDGDFGGGTNAAVKCYQKEKGLIVDGLVGPQTWKKLHEEEIPEPELFSKSLEYKCLVLAGLFETGKGAPECFCGISGDFDNQGMSLGVLQWNIGQRTLQPLLKQMLQKHTDEMEAVFGENLTILKEAMNAGIDEQLTFFRSIQDNGRHRIHEPWKGMFKALGRTEAFQALQVQAAKWRFERAKEWQKNYGLWSDRAIALMFDINVQNGSIPKTVRLQIMNDFEKLSSNLSKDNLEIEKMRIIANRRAEAANSRWVNDVRVRKLCIANGRGKVHGVEYDLEKQVGIKLTG